MIKTNPVNNVSTAVAQDFSRYLEELVFTTKMYGYTDAEIKEYLISKFDLEVGKNDTIYDIIHNIKSSN